VGERYAALFRQVAAAETRHGQWAGELWRTC